MSETDEASRTKSGEDRSGDRIDDPQAGLVRLRHALKKILRVPKEAIDEERAVHTERR